MPQLPPAEGVTQAVLNYTYGGERCANVLHFVQTDGVTAPDPEELASRLASWWGNNIDSLVPNTLSLDSVTATDLSAGGPPGVIYTTGLPNTGGSTNLQLPNQCTVVISLRTSLRGRSYRGRIYHVGIGEPDVDGSTVNSTFRQLLLNAYDNLLLLTGDTGEPDYQIAVLSYYSGGALRPEPVATPVTSMSVDSRIDTQRRRLPRR